MPQGGFGNGHRVFLFPLGEYIRSDAFAHDLELVDGRRTVDIAGDQQRALALLGLEVQRQFGGVRGLSGALQAAHEDDAGLAFEIEACMLSAHEFGELFLRDFHEELTRSHGGEDLLADGLVLHPIGEALGDAVVHIRLDEGTADFLGGFGNVGFGDRGLALDALKGFFEAVAEVLEHGDGKGRPGKGGP